jgi:hypothetical protein
MKIGRSTTLRRRRARIEAHHLTECLRWTGQPTELRVIHFRGGNWEEVVHYQFRELRAAGEWFCYTWFMQWWLDQWGARDLPTPPPRWSPELMARIDREFPGTA